MMGDEMQQDQRQQPAIQGDVSWSSATVDILSPKKMLVESATMIYILAFMLFTLVVLVWKGPQLGTGEMMALFFGLILTTTLAIRQYAAFRY